MESDEVVQLYLSHPGFSLAPKRELRGFQHVHLAPHQTKTVTFEVSGRDLSVVDAEGKRRIEAGTIKAWIGGGQGIDRDGAMKTAGVAGEFRITSSAVLPD